MASPRMPNRSTCAAGRFCRGSSTFRSMAAAIGCSEDDGPQLSAEAGAILGRWCTALTRAFVNDGFDDVDAASLAVTSIAALEGAIVLSRSTRNAGPLHQIGEQLEFLIKAREFVVRNKISGQA